MYIYMCIYTYTFFLLHLALISIEGARANLKMALGWFLERKKERKKKKEGGHGPTTEGGRGREGGEEGDGRKKGGSKEGGEAVHQTGVRRIASAPSCCRALWRVAMNSEQQPIRLFPPSRRVPLKPPCLASRSVS